MSYNSNGKNIQSLSLPWKWSNTPGSFLDERPRTKKIVETNILEPTFPPKCDKFPVDVDGYITCLKIDSDLLGNINSSDILITDVMYGPLDGGVF